MSSIQIKDLSFAYEAGGKLILKDINTEIGEGEFVCILGQSGCGKSTLLRCWRALRHTSQQVSPPLRLPLRTPPVCPACCLQVV